MTSRREPTNLVEPSFSDIAHAKIVSLCEALDLPERQTERILSVFDEMSTPWASWPTGDEPPWESDISDDGTPFEFSVAFDGGEPKLRLLVEAQSDERGPLSRFEAGLALNARLARAGKADLEVFDSIVDLFTPTRNDSRFQLWHAAELGRDGCLYKAYLNPLVLGAGAAPNLVREALDRLGMQSAWEHLKRHLDDPNHPTDIRYLSVDLVPRGKARVKIYLGRSTAEGVERLVDGIWEPGRARGWLSSLTGFDGPYEARPILTCFAYRPGESRPEPTLHVPVRCYAPSDADAADRAATFLSPTDADRFTRSLRAIAGRPLRTGRGLLTYVSLRDSASGVRVTTYIAPEVYTISARRPSGSGSEGSVRRIRVQQSAMTTLGDAQELIARRGRLFARHPFLMRLEGPGDLEAFRRFVPHLSFFVMTFQDVLRLTHQTCKEPAMRELARTHELEDGGHDGWFLNDLKILGVPCEVNGLFARDYQRTRDVAYTLVTEVLNATDDRTKIAVSLALEALAAEFFGRVIGFLERSGAGDGLQYFGAKHREAEASHEIFEADAQAWLGAIEIPPHAVAEVMRAIDKTFDAVTLLADEVLLAFDGRRPSAA